jgi:cytidylate kinase
MRQRPIVAIDGPAGAGKSTISKRVAEALGFVLVDTGAMYRSVALAAKRAGCDWNDAARTGAIAAELVAARAVRFERDAERGIRVFLRDDDVTDAIRAPDMGMGASTVSRHPSVREALLDLQRQAGQGGGVVLEGRDIGTVVFPDAEVKFFLTARPEVRAERRYKELVAKGEKVTMEQTLDEVKKRDAQDEGRAIAPLRKADDADLVDTSDMTIDEVVRAMVERVRR